MEMIKEFLDGKKTIIAAVVLFLIGGAQAAGFISADVADLLYKLTAAAGLAALRLGVEKSRK